MYKTYPTLQLAIFVFEVQVAIPATNEVDPPHIVQVEVIGVVVDYVKKYPAAQALT